MKTIYGKSGGYRKLRSFMLASIIQLETDKFCKRFISYKSDPLGKTIGQMNGAARSGRQNIIEGAERAMTSQETEIKLTDVARASLAELSGDFEMFLAAENEIPWAPEHTEFVAVAHIRLDEFERDEVTLHDFMRQLLKEREKYSRWLDSGDSHVVANAMIVIIRGAMIQLYRQLKMLESAFREEGGFRERMTAVRLEARDGVHGNVTGQTPPCPECAAVMRLRKARGGKSPGQAFWGCSRYPECKGTREAESEGTPRAT